MLEKHANRIKQIPLLQEETGAKVWSREVAESGPEPGLPDILSPPELTPLGVNMAAFLLLL